MDSTTIITLPAIAFHRPPPSLPGAGVVAVNMAGDKAEKVLVTLGLRDEQTERAEVTSGVKEGDRLLVGPAQAITPGTPLQLQGAPRN